METLKSSNAVNKQLLNIDEVRAITGFSTTTIYKYVKSGEFTIRPIFVWAAACALQPAPSEYRKSVRKPASP